MAKMKVIDDEELNALGRYFDERAGNEDEWGEEFTSADYGSSNILEAAQKHSAMQKSKNIATEVSYFRIPVTIAKRLKEKAKAQHKPYKKFVNEVLAMAAR